MASVSFDLNTGIVVSALNNLGTLSTIKRIVREVSEIYNLEITPDLEQLIQNILDAGTKLRFLLKKGNKYELASLNDDAEDDEEEDPGIMDAAGRRRRRRTKSPKRGKSRSRSRSSTRKTKK